MILLTNLVGDYLDFSGFSRWEFTLSAVAILLCYASILIVSALDVRSAIRRDKRFAHRMALMSLREGDEAGTLATLERKWSPELNSWGLKRTIRKLSVYYNILFAVGFVDMLLLVVDLWKLVGIVEVPYISVALALVFIGTEILSIWENSPKRDRDNIVKSLRRFRQTATELSRDLSSEDVKQLRQLLDEARRGDK